MSNRAIEGVGISEGRFDGDGNEGKTREHERSA